MRAFHNNFTNTMTKVTLFFLFSLLSILASVMTQACCEHVTTIFILCFVIVIIALYFTETIIRSPALRPAGQFPVSFFRVVQVVVVVCSAVIGFMSVTQPCVNCTAMLQHQTNKPAKNAMMNTSMSSSSSSSFLEEVEFLQIREF
jgi:hypothetical protein